MKKILLLIFILSFIFISGCMDNAAVGSVVRTKELKDMRLDNCLRTCNEMQGQERIDCNDLCYADIADSFDDKTLCRNIIDKKSRTECLIY